MSDLSPERIEEALAIIDAAPPYSHVPSSKMTLLEAADVVAAALREAQAEIEELRWADYNTLLASHEATSETVLALQAENERLRKVAETYVLPAALAPTDEAKP